MQFSLMKKKKFRIATNLLLSMPVNEIWKSINVWCSYDQRIGGLLSGQLCILWRCPEERLSFQTHNVSETEQDKTKLTTDD